MTAAVILRSLMAPIKEAISVADVRSWLAPPMHMSRSRHGVPLRLAAAATLRECVGPEKTCMAPR